MTNRPTLTTEQLNARDQAMLEVLRGKNVRNEDGGIWNTFTPQGRDSLDFATISRAKLRMLMNEAYAAGIAAERAGR